MNDAEKQRKLEVRRAQLTFAAASRAELGFEHSKDRINQRLDVIEPGQAEIAALAEGGKTLEIEAGD